MKIPVGVLSLLLVSSTSDALSLEAAKLFVKVRVWVMFGMMWPFSLILLSSFFLACIKPQQSATTIIGAWSLAGAGFVNAPDSMAMAANVEEGQKVFNANCAACHRGGQNMIVPEKTLEKEALDLYLSGGLSEESVIKQISSGKSSMPAFGGRLDDESIANVAAYVIKSAEEGWTTGN